MDDLEHMRRAIALAEEVRATTAPNPWVGAVVVPSGATRTYEGATAPPGGPHAEVTALAAAGAAARGATLYVTLEPCAHYGRTPPCTDAIIDTAWPVSSSASRTPTPASRAGDSPPCGRRAFRSRSAPPPAR